MNVVTAATVRRAFLEPALDALALNDAQDRLIQNDTPEADSMIEHLAALGPVVRGTRAVPNLITLFDQAISLRDWNRGEGGCVRVVSGHADGMVTDLRARELRGGLGGQPLPLAAKSVAHAIREPLRILVESTGEWPRLRAACDIERQVGHLPQEQLFSPAVTRELGKAKAAALRELYDRRENGAATPAKGRGATEPRGAAHGRSDGE